MHVILPQQAPRVVWPALEGLIRWALMLGPPGESHWLPAEFPR